MPSAEHQLQAFHVHTLNSYIVDPFEKRYQDFSKIAAAERMKMVEDINNELRLFIKDITLFLQQHKNYTAEKIEPMFQRAYKLYVKYDVENENN